MMRDVRCRVPLPVRVLVRLVVPADRRDDVLGDLCEMMQDAPYDGVRRWLGACAAGTSIAGGLLIERLGAGLLRGGEVVRGAASPARLAGLFSLLELKLAIRVIVRQPLLATTSVLALATAIALASSGFTLLSQTLWGRLPIPDGERFVTIETALPDGVRTGLTADRFEAISGASSVLESFGAWRNVSSNLVVRAGAEPVPVRVTMLTPASFEHVPRATLLGRPLLPADGVRGASRVLVLGEALWRARFAADPDVAGTIVNVGGEPYEIVGVMPAAWSFPHRVDAWTALDVESRGSDWPGALPGLRMYGVLAPGVSVAVARARLQSTVATIPGAEESETDVRVAVAPFTRPSQAGIGVFMGGVVISLVLVLIVVSGNVANLVLARTVARSGELSIRSSLGASRSRLIGQITFEVLVLGAVAAALGIAASVLALGRLRAAVPALPWWMTLRLDVRAIAFVVALAILATAVAGTVPAVRATRGAALGAATRGAGDALRFGRFSATMIVMQFAVSTAALAGGAVMLRALLAYSVHDYGLPAGDVLTAAIYFDPPLTGEGAARTIDDAAMTRTFEAVVRELSSMPGDPDIGIATDLPGTQSGVTAYEIENPPPGGIAVATVSTASVTAGWFEAIDSRPLAGRTFATGDAQGRRVVVVNQPFVDTYLGGRNAVGRRIRLRSDAVSPEPWSEIIGVVPDLGMSPGDPARSPGVYRLLRATNSFHLAARADGSPSELIGPIRRAVAAVDPAIRVDDVMLLERAGWENRALLRGTGLALAAMGLMALILSVTSTWALVAFSVSRRKREIGIRRALGGGTAGILGTIMSRSLRQLAIGGGAGALLAAAVLRLTALIPFPVAAPAWVVPAVVSILLTTGATAAFMPARAALSVRPIDALRSD